MVADRIAALDTQLFGHVESQTSDADRKSLLAIHDGVAARAREGFSYLEIGSHLGGTLQVVLADPRCRRVVSIDPRPQFQPDDRPDLGGWEYENNSTERMVDSLRQVPGADLLKLVTVEVSTEDLAPGHFARPDFCFIDGEHTYEAALRDARFCRTVMHGAGVIAFHDSGAVERAILAFLRETARPHRAYSLWSTVFVVELGADLPLLTRRSVRSQLHRPQLGWIAANRLAGDTAFLTADAFRRTRKSQRQSRGR